MQLHSGQLQRLDGALPTSAQRSLLPPARSRSQPHLADDAPHSLSLQIRFENDMNHRSIRANKLRQITQLPRTMTDDPTQSASTL
jgi:hypothetical protein